MDCPLTVPPHSQIAEFYHGTSIFITGATGFMGKVLVEKLLRSCPGVKKIYLLLRSKKGVDPRERLEELLNNQLFKNITETRGPEVRSKIVIIPGDLAQADLGISANDSQKLIDEVSIVFHSAATVKFEEPLKTSIEFNLLGTRRVIQLCHKMKQLKALIHVSTAYANCNRSEIGEILYPTPCKPQQLIDSVEWMNEDILETITPKLVDDRPNTYTFTKALAEALVAEECKDLPVAIVRPSIVTAAWREPIPGWVDNLNGPTGLVLGVGAGVMRTMLCEGSAVADLIPVDVVINLMITAAWYTGSKQPNEMMIYNCTSGSLNPLKWNEIEKIAFDSILRYPSSHMLRYPGGTFKRSRWVNNICMLLEQTIPAYVFDAIFGLMGRKKIMVRAVDRMHKASRSLEWFTTHQWQFKCDNVLRLHQQLTGSDSKTFAFDVRELQWPSYWDDYVLGIRRFISKEDNSSLPAARHSLQRLYYTERLAMLAMLLGIWRLFPYRTQLTRRMWFFSTTLAMRIYNLAHQS